jgi:hypothetical protein
VFGPVATGCCYRLEVQPARQPSSVRAEVDAKNWRAPRKECPALIPRTRGSPGPKGLPCVVPRRRRPTQRPSAR